MKTPKTDAAEIEVCHVDDDGGGFIKAVPSIIARDFEMEVERLQSELDKQISVTIGQMQTIRELRDQYKRLHTQVSGYLSGKELEHWQEYNNPKYAPAEPANDES